MLSPFTRLLILLLAPALAAAVPAAAGAGAGQQTWRAKLIDGSLQGYCVPTAFYQFIEDFTAVYPSDKYGGAYPPVLFANATFNGVFLGGAHASAAGYKYGWTWAGTCITGFYGQLLSGTPCSCNVNLQPADGGDFTLYMACSLPYGSGQSQCLGSYTFTPLNASSHS